MIVLSQKPTVSGLEAQAVAKAVTHLGCQERFGLVGSTQSCEGTKIAPQTSEGLFCRQLRISVF